jgi:hypothetical protein
MDATIWQGRHLRREAALPPTPHNQRGEGQVTPQEAIIEINEKVSQWALTYEDDDENGSPCNPFYLIDDLTKILDQVES